jgi:uncharacterized protein (TIGR03067 family)
MKQTCWIALAAVLLLGANEQDPDASARDLEAMQGAWTMVSFEVNGNAVSEAQTRTGRLVVKGDKYAPTLGGRKTTLTMVLDASKTPRTMDLTFEDGPNRGQTVKGIFKIEGDRLTVCRGLGSDTVRPVEFSTGAESGLSLVVWRRTKGAG